MIKKIQNKVSEQIHFWFYNSIGPKWIWTWKTLATIQHNTLHILTEIHNMAATLADVQAKLAELTPRLNNIDSSLAKIQTYEDQQGASQDFQGVLDTVNTLADHVSQIEAKADQLDDVATPVVGNQPPAADPNAPTAPVTGGGETPSNGGSADLPEPSTTPAQSSGDGNTAPDAAPDGDSSQVG